jgi:hypothetical protein
MSRRACSVLNGTWRSLSVCAFKAHTPRRGRPSCRDKRGTPSVAYTREMRDQPGSLSAGSSLWANGHAGSVARAARCQRH